MKKKKRSNGGKKEAALIAGQQEGWQAEWLGETVRSGRSRSGWQ
jgi:hypothetical protein